MLVSRLCLTLCDLMECSPPGSSVYGILQARILEWVVIFFSRGLLDPGVEAESPVSQRVCDIGNSGNLCVCVCVCVCVHTHTHMASQGGMVVKNPPANAGDTGLITWLERSSGGGNGNLLQ